MTTKLFQMLFITSMICFGYQSAKGQYVLNEADKQYNLNNYSQAVKLYNQAYQKKKSTHATQRLADCYRHLHNYKQTESWYAKLAAMSETDARNIFYYAEALRNNSKYGEAKIQYMRYGALDRSISRHEAQIWTLSCDSSLLWMKEPKQVSIMNEADLNTSYSEWAAFPYSNGVLFTSDRELDPSAETNQSILKFDNRDFIDRQKDGRTGNTYLGLYTADKGIIKAFPLGESADFHRGPASMNVEGNQIFYTITRELNKAERQKIKGNEIISLNTEIFSSLLVNGAWEDAQPFPYNNIAKWSVGDPYITTNGMNLFFVSDKPGGIGGTDLYVCEKQRGDTWGEAINLGPTVNTPGNERTPFISDGYLYYSSDGLVGMGGLDIYKAEIRDGKIEGPVNMGYPINSPQDDLSFNLKATKQGYLSSDREGGKGSDDIYSFIINEKIKLLLEGFVQNKNTGTLLNNAIVTLSNKATAVKVRTQTDENGMYKLLLDSGLVYEIAVEKTNFRLTHGAVINTQNILKNVTIRRDFLLEPVVLHKEVLINNIFYNFDEWDIRADAVIELDKLVKLLKDNSTWWIVLGSHTDSRGRVAYNKILSQRRAESVVKYLVGKGIEEHRLKASGYGESKLLNKCSAGVPCTEIEHQMNRRTEFTIVEE